ncbi:MAG: single-stranded DNA-binding protein [Dysosmobacter sp.]
MYNHTGLQGRLTADPELRYTQQGTAIASFTLASDTGRKTKDGKKITNFIECVAWRAQAEFVCKVPEQGPPRPRRGRAHEPQLRGQGRQPPQGRRITVDSVHFCDSKKDGGQSSGSDFADPGYSEGSSDFTEIEGDGDLPFNLTAGRPADDQKQATNQRPQKGGDDRGMAASASDTQGSPQTVRRC